MNAQVRAIAADPQFLVMFNQGMYRKDLAEHYGCKPRTIGQVYEYMGLTGIAKEDRAPSPEEETLSMSSLELAPTIAARAKVARELYLQKLRDEPLLVTQKRVQEWRATQL